ncbi:MAG TPA: suppressor of fused domain protein [Candidatus Obscuribacterales bacterium]
MNTGSTNLLFSAWKARNRVYEELFGQPAYALPKGNVPPTNPEPGIGRVDGSADNEADTTTTFKSQMTDVKITVLAYAPTESRPHWIYITSGLSNPWFAEEPNEVSGFGCELMVKSNKDARWAVRLLRRLCYYILSYSGTLSPGVILNMPIPLGSGGTGDLNNLVVWYADEAPDCLYQLPSGVFGVFCTIGITEDECKFAESIDEYGPWSIQQVLRNAGLGQVTDPQRKSVMDRKDIKSILESVRNYAENFRPVQ